MALPRLASPCAAAPCAHAAPAKPTAIATIESPACTADPRPRPRPRLCIGVSASKKRPRMLRTSRAKCHTIPPVMIALIQRVTQAEVRVGGEAAGAIGRGVLALLGGPRGGPREGGPRRAR